MIGMRNLQTLIIDISLLSIHRPRKLPHEKEAVLGMVHMSVDMFPRSGPQLFRSNPLLEFVRHIPFTVLKRVVFAGEIGVVAFLGHPTVHHGFHYAALGLSFVAASTASDNIGRQSECFGSENDRRPDERTNGHARHPQEDSVLQRLRFLGGSSMSIILVLRI